MGFKPKNECTLQYNILGFSGLFTEVPNNAMFLAAFTMLEINFEIYP
jgi:hypothetical protein